jgi:putative peptidoglycan lipid II flippase
MKMAPPVTMNTVDENSKDSNSLNVVVSTTAVAIIAGLLKLLGYVEKKVIAYYFGTGDALDAFLVALNISLLGYFLFRGLIRPALLPLLVSAKNRSPLEARNFGLSVAIATIILSGFAATLGIVFAPDLVHLFAKGFAAPKQALSVHLTRLLFPALLVMNVAYLLYVSLHTQKRFATAAWGECLQKVVFVLLIIFVVVRYGFNFIALGVLGGAVSLLAFYALIQRKRLRVAGPFEFTGGLIKQLALLAWPIIVGGLVSQGGQLIQTRVASSLASGSIAALDYSRKIIDLPLVLVPMALSLVVFPYFSEFADKEDARHSYGYLSQSVRVLMLLFIPLSIFVFVFRQEIVLILFGGGAFSKSSILLTGNALAGYAPGLAFSAIEMILMSYFFAHRKMLMAIACGMGATCTGIGALLVLPRYLGLAGVSSYLTVSRCVKIVLLLYCLRYLKVSILWRSAWEFIIRQLAAVSGTIAVYALLSALFFHGFSAAHISHIFGFAVKTSLLFVLYILALYLLRFPEFERLWGALRGKFARAKKL